MFTVRQIQQLTSGLKAHGIDVQIKQNPRTPEGGLIEAMINVLEEYHSTLNPAKQVEFLDDIQEILEVKKLEINAISFNGMNKQASIIATEKAEVQADLDAIRERKEGRGNANPRT